MAFGQGPGYVERRGRPAVPEGLRQEPGLPRLEIGDGGRSDAELDQVQGLKMLSAMAKGRRSKPQRVDKVTRPATNGPL